MGRQADKLERSPVKPGDILAGKYRVERLLGAGGMGVVAAARHLDLDELRAVKFLLPEAQTESEIVERFMREARAVVKMKNPHVVQVYDIGRFEGGEPYIVMEYLEGRDLKSVLQEQGTLSVEAALRVALQTLEAMAEAHSLGIVHRDLKPANIFLTRDHRDHVSAKVLDFGISKLLDPDEEGMEMTTTHAVMGSPYYMSPEQMMSSRDVDARADIWSIGVVLYQMLTGRVPFRGKNIAAQCALLLQKEAAPPSTVGDMPLPDGLDDAVLGFLRRDVEARHRTVAASAIALAPFLGSEGHEAARRIASVLRRSRNSLDVAPDVASSPKNDVSDIATQSTIQSNPRAAAANELMSQSTKATWQTTAGTRRPRRASLVVAASVAVGTTIILAAVIFRTTEPSPATDVEPPAQAPALIGARDDQSDPMAASAKADEHTPEPVTSTAVEAENDSRDGEASTDKPVPESPPPSRLPRRRVPKKPAPPPKKTEPEDPFEGREPLR